jgi:hypothetical protein
MDHTHTHDARSKCSPCVAEGTLRTRTDCPWCGASATIYIIARHRPQHADARLRAEVLRARIHPKKGGSADGGAGQDVDASPPAHPAVQTISLVSCCNLLDGMQPKEAAGKHFRSAESNRAAPRS